MNKYVKKGLSLVFATALIASSFAGCAKVNYVTNGTIKAINEVKDGSWKTGGADAATDEAAGDTDEVVIDSFEAGTYGGVEFKSLDDVASYYKEVYDNTKSQTAKYKNEDGSEETFYDLLGYETLEVGDVMIDGSSNAVINKLVPGIVGGLFQANLYGLPPCYNRNPELDNNKDDTTKKADHDFRTTDFSVDDILDANVKDNGDGTITMVIQPKKAEMSMRGDDSQGRFFEVLGDIGATVSSISVLSFSEGDATDNVKVTYAGGYGTITIDTKTKTVTAADYFMNVTVAVNHANVTVLHDKSAELGITYHNIYPADAAKIKEVKGLVKE